MNATDEAQKIWKALQPTIDNEIDQRTRACVKMKSMVVTTAYNSTTKKVGVKEAFGNEISLPVYSNMDTTALTKGTAVWVMMPFGSMSNAIVFMRGNGE